jgi:biotin carboxylase
MAEVRRLFGQEAGGGNDTWRKAAAEAQQFDLSKVNTIPPKGHVVAVRVTSEDPDDGFKPTSGHVQVTTENPSIHYSLFKLSLKADVWLQSMLWHSQNEC